MLIHILEVEFKSCCFYEVSPYFPSLQERSGLYVLLSAFVIRPTKSQTRYCQEQNKLEEDSKTGFQTCEKKVMCIM